MQVESAGPVTGPLQERIMLALSENKLCGKDLMMQLGIGSPGTIYPVLDMLRKRGLVEFEAEAKGAVRRKNYSLTVEGRRYIRESLTRSAGMFCCDLSLYAETIMGDIASMMTVEKHHRVLCTLEYTGMAGLLGGADVTFSSDLSAEGEFDVVLAFPGIGRLLGGKHPDPRRYLASVKRKMKRAGRLMLVEIERTDNLFARVFFTGIRKMDDMPGMNAEELRSILKGAAGLADVEVRALSGLLYGSARKVRV